MINLLSKEAQEGVHQRDEHLCLLTAAPPRGAERSVVTSEKRLLLFHS